jgi:hypothetical protein
VGENKGADAITLSAGKQRKVFVVGKANANQTEIKQQPPGIQYRIPSYWR